MSESSPVRRTTVSELKLRNSRAALSPAEKTITCDLRRHLQAAARIICTSDVVLNRDVMVAGGRTPTTNVVPTLLFMGKRDCRKISSLHAHVRPEENFILKGNVCCCRTSLRVLFLLPALDKASNYDQKGIQQLQVAISVSRRTVLELE